MKPHYFIIACLLSSASFANDIDKQSAVIAFNNFNVSLIKYEKAEEKCNKTTELLPKDFFDNSILSKKEKLTVLKYLYFKSLLNCSQQALNKYLTNAAILTSINPSYKEMVDQSNRLIIAVNISLLKSKIAYDQLDQEKTKKITPSNTPFDLLKSAAILGIN